MQALITNEDIETMLDEELATVCIRSEDDELKDLGRDLQQAVDDERSGAEIRKSIKIHLGF